MNERILELARQVWPDPNISHVNHMKFAELIVKECIQQAHAVSDLRGTNDDMIYGADTAAVRISKHFGVK